MNKNKKLIVLHRQNSKGFASQMKASIVSCYPPLLLAYGGIGERGQDLSPAHLVANTFLICCHFLYFSRQRVDEQVGQYNCLHIKP